MKTTLTKPAKKDSALTRAPRTPLKAKPGTNQVSPNPASSEVEGGRKGALDGRFEADHRPSR